MGCRILYGDSAPFFALVGVSLASGTGILTKEDELEGVCWEIRVSFPFYILFLIQICCLCNINHEIYFLGGHFKDKMALSRCGCR